MVGKYCQFAESSFDCSVILLDHLQLQHQSLCWLFKDHPGKEHADPYLVQPDFVTWSKAFESME